MKVIKPRKRMLLCYSAFLHQQAICFIQHFSCNYSNNIIKKKISELQAYLFSKYLFWSMIVRPVAGWKSAVRLKTVEKWWSQNLHEHSYFYLRNLNSIFTWIFIQRPTGLIWKLIWFPPIEVFKQRLGGPYSEFCKGKSSNADARDYNTIRFPAYYKLLSQ